MTAAIPAAPRTTRTRRSASGRPGRLTQLGIAASVRELADEQAATARIACEQLTAPVLLALEDSIQRACRMPSRPGWEHKAAAHAETFRLLAAAATSRQMVAVPGSADLLLRDVMIAVGPAVNGMIVSSRRRLLAHLRSRDAASAAGEMEDHLGVLDYLWRLATYTAQAEPGNGLMPR